MPPSLAAPEPVGLAIAALLLLALVALLPQGERRLARQPLLWLAAHLVAFGVLGLAPAAAPWRRAALLVSTLLLLASIGRSAVLLVLDVFVGARLQRPPPRIVRDLTQGIVWLAILLAALPIVGVEPSSILTTSALLTAAVALSLQETLGNLMAGLAIQLQRPFDVGDWIQFDGELKHIGHVVEINWRATKVITLDEVEVTVPNATLAKAAITNFTKPTRTSRRSLYVYAPADVPPHLVHGTILSAIAGSNGVVEKPAPSVVTNAFVEGNVEYWVRFFTESFHLRDGVDGAARDRIWYALRRLGVTAAASPNRAVHVQEVSAAAREREEQALAARERALRAVDFLAALDDDARRRLALASHTRLYTRGEAIVTKGETSAELFVVEEGEVEVVLGDARDRGDGGAVVARLGAGKFFGEMALMTGEPRNATVRASVPCRLLALDDRAMRHELEAAPELAGHISRVIADRQAANAAESASAAASAAQSVEERSSQLLGRIRKFFSLT
jgi:small-conductance mechanosensitive channel/CRP-like cAMP-binding protein